MTSNDRNQEWVHRVVQLLKESQEQFGSDENDRGFHLFDSSSFGSHDLLFRDDTHQLVEVGSKDSWEKWLGQEYLRCVRSHHSAQHPETQSMGNSEQPVVRTSEGRPVLLSNLHIQDTEGHSGRYHVHATVNQGGHLWIRDGLDSIVFTTDAKSMVSNRHHHRHHRHHGPSPREETSHMESELSREDSSSSDVSQRDVESVDSENQDLTMDDDFYEHYRYHHFEFSNNGRPSLSFTGDLASVQKALSNLVFVPWCDQWPAPPNWDLPPSTWMFPSQEDMARSEDPNRPAIWPAWYPRFWYPFPTKSWTWWPRVLPPYWLNQQCQDWTSLIHISVTEEAPSSCASRQDRQDHPVTDMNIPVHVQSRTSEPISLIPRNLFYYFDGDAESVHINDISIRSQRTDVNLQLKFKVMEDHLATIQAESVESPEFSCTSVDECNEILSTVKLHFKTGVRATDVCHLGIQVSMFKENSEVLSDLLTVWAYQTSGRCVDPWATNSNFHLREDRSQTNQGQTVNINLIPDDLSNEESLNGILHVKISAPHGLVTYTAPDGLRTYIDHMGIRQRIPTNMCVSGPAEMVKQALRTVKYTPIRGFTGTENITIEYGTTRTAMRLSPDSIHPKMTTVHQVEVHPVSSPILVQAPSHMCVHHQRPLPHIDTNLQCLWHKPAPNMVKLTVTATHGDVNINQQKMQEEFQARRMHSSEEQHRDMHSSSEEQHRRMHSSSQEHRRMHSSSEEHHRRMHSSEGQHHRMQSSHEQHHDMVRLDMDVQHRQRASGSWLQVTAEDWVVRHILHHQMVWYKPTSCAPSQQPLRHDTIHLEVEDMNSEHVTSSEIQVTVDCSQNSQPRWSIDGVSSEQQSHEHVSSEHRWFDWREMSPWPVEKTSSQERSSSQEQSSSQERSSSQSSSQDQENSESDECVPSEPWGEWSDCEAESCQSGSQWRERRTRNVNPRSNRFCPPQRQQRQCTNCGCRPVQQHVKHPSPSFQNCQTVNQVPRCPETCKPTKTSFVEQQFSCRGRTLNKDVEIHEACACTECAAKYTKESWHSSEREPTSDERWFAEVDDFLWE